MKNLIKKILFKEKYNSQTYVNYLRKLGMKIGYNTTFYDVRSIQIDETRPWLIEIGDNVQIAKGVTILTHGYDFCVLMNVYGNVYGSSGKICIGNNIFIGTNSTILKGVTIGDNVIIGANSLVSNNIPNNVVVAGNPAKVIMSLDEYKKKRELKYIDEAKELAIEYYKTYGKKPTIQQFHEFFFIMLKREDINSVNFGFLNIPIIKKSFLNTEPLYNGLDEFLQDCNINP